MGELVEVLKASIDPDSIITAMTLNGKELTENDWRMPLANQGSAVVEIATGSRQTYVSDRLASASLYLDEIVKGFAESRILLKSGDVQRGNTSLSKAVQDLKAFVDWYTTVLQILPSRPEAELQKFQEGVRDLTSVCEQLLQQQLYRAWWAIADTLEKKLEPQLGQVKSSCINIYRVYTGQ